MYYNNIFKHYKTIYDLVKDTMIETKQKERGAGARLLTGTGDRTNAKNVSESENKIVCPDCGETVRFGSRDPCEGDYFWCDACGHGPFLFPLGIREMITPPLNDDQICGYPDGVFTMVHAILDKEGNTANRRSE
jgi:hypothetical protein